MSYIEEREFSRERLRTRERLDTHIIVDQSVCVHFILLRIEVGVTSSVRTDDKVGQHLVDTRIRLIFHDAKNVETRENGFGEFDILGEGDCRVVAPADRIRSCNDSATSLKSCDDTSF